LSSFILTLLTIAPNYLNPSIQGQVAPVGAGPSYTIVAGDTCVRAARKMGITIDQLHAANPQLGKISPHALVPGQLLKSALGPVAPNQADAQLTYIKPDVDRRPAAKKEWNPAAVNEALFRMDEVSTRKGAGAELTFKDDSKLRLQESAVIVVLGGDNSPSKQRKGSEVELVQGELSVFLSQLRGTTASSLNVKTKSGDVKAAGESNIGLDDKKMMRLSSYTGNATVSAQGKQVKVVEGQGTRVEQGKVPEKPRPLPKAPLLAPAYATRGFFSKSEQNAVSVIWSYDALSKTGRTEVAREPKFVDVAASQVIEVKDAKAAPPMMLGPGHYLARGFAYDAAGLKSKPSAVSMLDIVQIKRANGSEFKGKLNCGEVMQLSEFEGVTVPQKAFFSPGKRRIELRNDSALIDSVDVEIARPTFEVSSKENVVNVKWSNELADASHLFVKLGEVVVPVNKDGVAQFSPGTTARGALLMLDGSIMAEVL
jgi:FecR protein/LysM domain